jgi:GTP1/Obg family GTP-binding protein
MLVKQLKRREKNMQELTDSIKRPNLRIIKIEKGEVVQVKGICNIFYKIIAENFPNLENIFPFRYKKPLGHQTDLTKVEPPHSILSPKQ